jgi:hypothetical protein
MADCGILNGVGINCDDLKKIGGVKKTVFVGNISDLTTALYTIDVDGYVTAINFAVYAGLYAFTGRKASHSFGSEGTKQSPGGNSFWTQTANIKLFPGTPTDDQTIEDLFVAETFAVFEDNNQQFYLLGAFNGLDGTTDTFNTGQEAASDIGNTIVLTGEENKKWLRVNLGTYATTLAYLESLVV